MARGVCAAGVAHDRFVDRAPVSVLMHDDLTAAGHRAFSRFQNTYDFSRQTVGHDLSDASPAGRPPVVYNAPAGNSDATTYDFVGRMFYLRLSHQY